MRPDGDDRPATRFSDVCGTIDEIKRVLHQGDGDTEPRSLLQDITAMLDRMDLRAREYVEFVAGLRRLVESTEAIEACPRATARPLEERVAVDVSADQPDVQGICRDLEAIRDVANSLERILRRHRESATRAHQAYLRIRGERNWTESAPGEGLPVHLHAWLPPSPHREVVLEWLSRGRLHVAEGSEGDQPVAIFEDGGKMPLHSVRWSEEVSNFTSAGTPSPPPAPSAREPR